MLKINMEAVEKEYEKYENIARAYVESGKYDEEGDRCVEIAVALNYLLTWYPLRGKVSEMIMKRFKTTGYDMAMIMEA